MSNLVQDNNTYILYENIGGLPLYDKIKAKMRFCKTEIKVLEEAIEQHCRTILSKNGIIVQDNSKSAVEHAFDTLNAKGKRIVITDIYENGTLFNGILVDRVQGLNVMLEDNCLLQCGAMVEEKEI